jgi:hypothetical protein
MRYTVRSVAKGKVTIVVRALVPKLALHPFKYEHFFIENMINTYLFHHCKEPLPKIRRKHSQKRNCVATGPISKFTKFICILAIYMLPRLICLFYCRKSVDRPWEYINRSQTRECGNWDWGRAIPRKGILIWDFRCSVTPLRQSLIQAVENI